MKRYLVCTLLVVNAVPAQADNTTMLVGGAVVVGGGAYYWHNQQQAKKKSEEKKRAEAEALTRKRKQDELDNVATGTQIIGMTKDILDSSKSIDAEFAATYNNEDAAIAELNAKEANGLAALLEACKNGVAAKCAERLALVQAAYDRSIIATQRAARLGARTTQRAQWMQDLETQKDIVLATYDELKEIGVEENKDFAPLNEMRFQATLSCTEGNACNGVIEKIDEAIAACKSAAQDKRRDAKAKLDAAWKKFIATRDALNDATEQNAIAKNFPARYSAPQEIPPVVGGPAVITQSQPASAPDFDNKQVVEEEIKKNDEPQTPKVD